MQRTYWSVGILLKTFREKSEVQIRVFNLVAVPLPGYLYRGKIGCTYESFDLTAHIRSCERHIFDTMASWVNDLNVRRCGIYLYVCFKCILVDNIILQYPQIEL